MLDFDKCLCFFSDEEHYLAYHAPLRDDIVQHTPEEWEALTEYVEYETNQ